MKVKIKEKTHSLINMEKTVIRLTEEDLHRIVKESVERILSEEVNELSPGTLERYADGRAKQGKFFKSFLGRKAARQARRERGEDIPLVHLDN